MAGVAVLVYMWVMEMSEKREGPVSRVRRIINSGSNKSGQHWPSDGGRLAEDSDY